MTKSSQKTCSICHKQFSITDLDKKYLAKVQPTGQELPEPSVCYKCSFLQKLTFKNEISLYQRKCDKTGKQIISVYSPDKKFLVWNQEDWQSDQLQAEQYAQNIDWHQPFFSQLKELYDKVPKRHIYQYFNPENSNFCNDIEGGKNQYMCFLTGGLEDCYYTHDSNDLEKCVDCFRLFNSQNTYMSIMSDLIYNSKYVLRSSKISDSAFIFNSTNLKNCFLCFNLHNKEYCIQNKQYTKDEYQKQLAKFDLGSRKTVNKLWSRFLEESEKFPIKSDSNKNVENVIGDLCVDVKNAYMAFDALGPAQDVKDIANFGLEATDLYRCYAVLHNVSHLYETISCADSSNVYFSFEILNSSQIWYSISCERCEYLFGCVGLRDKKYCIFNKQYEADEYFSAVQKLIAQMKKNKEFGSFFPLSFSPFCYNETRASYWYPLSKESAIKLGMTWKDENPKNVYFGSTDAQKDNIADVNDQITEAILKCNYCPKFFKITKQELTFYHENSVPIPEKCFFCRYQERLEHKPKAALWKRKCFNCQTDVYTSYPKRKLMCAKCYNHKYYG